MNELHLFVYIWSIILLLYLCVLCVVSQIQYISYDGGTVMNISGEQLRSSKPYAVSAHQNILFWSQIESEIGSIYALNLTSSYASKLFNSTYLKPYDLAAALDTSMLPSMDWDAKVEMFGNNRSLLFSVF